MIKEIVLDVRSDVENSDGSLYTRVLKNRGGYGNSVRGSILYMSEGNGSMLRRGEEVLGSESVLGVIYEGEGMGYSGEVYRGEGGDILRERGMVYSWTRNDEMRKRFDEETNKLLAGGLREELGLVGGDLKRLKSVKEWGVIEVGGIYRGVLGREIRVVSEGVDFEEGEIVLVELGGLVRVRGLEVGLPVYFTSDELGLVGMGEGFRVGEGGVRISPVPYPYEEILIRVEGEGLIEVSYGGELREGGGRLDLETGLLELGEGLREKRVRYEGLLLGRGLELLEELEVNGGEEIGMGDELTSGLEGGGELLGLGEGLCYLRVGGRLIKLERGEVARGRYSAVVDRFGVLRVGVGLEGEEMRLVQGMVAPLFTRGEGVCYSQRRVLGESGLVLLEGGLELSYSGEGVVSDESLGYIVGGFLVTRVGVLLDKNESEGGLNIGILRGGFGDGVYLGVRGEESVGYVGLEDYVLSERVRGGSIYQFIDFAVRMDMGGYEEGKILKSRGEVLSGLEYELFEGRVVWMSSGSLSGEIGEESWYLPVGVGLRSVSLELEGEILEEGIDYDILGSGVRLLEGVGLLLEKGWSSEGLGGGVLRVYGSILGGVGNLIKVGGGDYYRILGVVSEGEGFRDMELSGGLVFEGGVWEIYEGSGLQVERGRLVGECLKGVSLYDERRVLVRILGIELGKERSGSVLYMRGLDGEDILVERVLSEELRERRVSLSDSHYLSGDYGILVDGVEVFDYEVGEDGLLSFGEGVSSTSVVTYERRARSVEGVVELDDRGEYGIPEGVEFKSWVEELGEGAYRANSLGVVSLESPLREGESVELEYISESGERLVESVIFLVQREECERVSGLEYSYRGGLYEGLEAVVEVGGILYEGQVSVGVGGQIYFTREVSEGVGVTISYGRFGALGGEYVVRASGSFDLGSLKLGEGSSELVLGGRVSLEGELSEGDVIDMGDHSFMVTGVVGNKISLYPSARFGIDVGLRGMKRVTTGDIWIEASSVGVYSDKGSSDIWVMGDFTRMILASSFVSVSGEPYRVRGASYEKEKGLTQIKVYGITGGLSAESFYFSVRSILEEGATQMSLGGVIEEKGYVLIREEGGVGVELERGRDYVLNAESGLLSLKGGYRVEEGVVYTLRHTAYRKVSPYYGEKGVLIRPKYLINYTIVGEPSNLVGYPLYMKCFVEAKDKYVIPVVNEDEYDAEVAVELEREFTRTSSRWGSKPVVRRGVSLGLYDSLGRDVVARNRLRFYHGVVDGVDRLQESMSGVLVGAEEGRFKFKYEQGEIEDVPAGYEDPITREIKARNVGEEYMGGIGVSESDLTSGLLSEVLRGQLRLVENEIDDRVLVGVVPERQRTLLFPYISMSLRGVYKGLYESSQYSRFYPTRGRFSTITFGSDVESTAGRETGSGYVSTRGDVIGVVENPVLGQIGNIVGLSEVVKRVSRFRVYDYSSTGFDWIAGTEGKPTFLLVCMNIGEVPLTAEGRIDTSLLGTEEYPSVETGDASKSYLGLSVGMCFDIGREGQMREIYLNNEYISVDSVVERARARVLGIYEGCAVVVSGVGASLEWGGETFLENPPKRGDTFAESLKGDINEDSSHYYRIGRDIGLRSGTGELIDIVLPSLNDPAIGLRELEGQNIPAPLTPLEGVVEFARVDTDPLRIPALFGESLNDDGDESLPFISLRGSERSYLRSAYLRAREIRETEYEGAYVYPSEISSTASVSNGVLIVAEGLTPFSEGLTSTKDTESGDLVLVNPSEATGLNGFIEIGRVEGQEISPVRFKTPVSGGVKYEIISYYEGGGFKLVQGYDEVNLKYTFEVDFGDLQSVYVFDLLEGATGVGSYNRVEIPIFGVVLRFTRSESSWRFGYEGGIDQIMADIEVSESGVSFSCTDRLGDLLFWEAIQVGGGVFSVFDVIEAKDFVLDGAGGLGELYTMDLKMSDGQISLALGVSSDVEGGSQTAQILEDRVVFVEAGLYEKESAEIEIKGSLISLYSEGGGVVTTWSSVNNGTYGVKEYKEGGEVWVYAAVSDEGDILTRAEISLSVLGGSRYDKEGVIFEDSEAEIGSIEVISGVVADVPSKKNFIGTEGDLSRIREGDIVNVRETQNAGVYLVNQVVTEEIIDVYNLSLGLLPRITGVTFISAGVYEVSVSADISDFYQGLSGVYVVTDWAGIQVSSSYVTSAVKLSNIVDISEDGKTFRVSGLRLDLEGGEYPETYGELLRAGQVLFNVDRLPYSVLKTGFVTREIYSEVLDVAFSGKYNDGDVGVVSLEGVERSEEGFITHLNLSGGLKGLVDETIVLDISIKKGIYLKWEFPRMGQDYGGLVANYFGSATAYGFRDVSALIEGDLADGVYVEKGLVRVSRLRRFSEPHQLLMRDLYELSGLYEIRKGLIDHFEEADGQVRLYSVKTDRMGEADEYGWDTQVGDFPSVISVGDKVRVFEGDTERGVLKVVQVERGVLSCVLVKGVILGGVSFKVETLSGLIPQEQVYEEMLSLYDLVYLSETGYVDVENELRDEGGIDFQVEGITQGDFIVVDSGGGSAPKGDRGRFGTTGYEVGSVAEDDDNRGVYKIISVLADKLVVEGVASSQGVSPSGVNYLPSVDGDTSNPLRVTGTDPSQSLPSFTFRVLRRNTKLGADFAQTLLFLRERLLSWKEKLLSVGSVPEYDWSGYVARRYAEKYIGGEDISVVDNSELDGLIGETLVGEDVAIVSSRDCLSLLDRRYLVEDRTLISDGFGTEVGEGVESLLNQDMLSMEAREKRYAWLNIRINPLRGTLVQASRAVLENINEVAVKDLK